MSKDTPPKALITITDPKLYAAAVVRGGTLENLVHDPVSNRIAFHFSGLPATFIEDCFNNKITIPLTPFLDAIERAYAMFAQYKARARGGR